MTPAETARLLLLVRMICGTPDRPAPDRPALDWHRALADLTAGEALAAAIQVARRRSEVTAHDVRTEALAIRVARPAAVDPPAAVEPPDPAGRTAAMSWRVACPWCGAVAGAPCTVRGSDTRLRRRPAHPLRLATADLVGFVESGSG
jgi:hypothetical protein